MREQRCKGSKQNRRLQKRIRACKRPNIAEPMVKGGINIGMSVLLTCISTTYPELGGYLLTALGAGGSELAALSADSVFQKFQSRKTQKFLDSVCAYRGILSEDTIQQIEAVPFIVEMAKTVEVIERLASDKKVNFLCHCFGKYFLEENHGEDVDRYEEFLCHLDTLSYREIDILAELYKLENTSRYEYSYAQNEKPNKVQKHSMNCHVLAQLAEQKWGIGKGELTGILGSLCRSGFLKEDVGAFLDYSGGAYYTTEYFQIFLSYIMPDLQELCE